MPQPLTDADIARYDSGSGSRPLTDADIAAHDAQPNSLGPGTFGPTPDFAQIGNRVFSNIGGMLKNLPSGVMAFVRHPIETTKAAVGQMDLEHPENSSGLLGLPDVLYRKLQSGEETPQQVTGDIATLALPGATTERAGLAGEALAESTPARVVSAGLRGAKKALPNAIETSALRYTGAPQLARGALTEIRKTLQPQVDEMLEGIARSQTGRSYANLDPAAQQTVRDIAQRLNSSAASNQPATTPTRQGPQLVLPRQFPPKNIRDIAQQELGGQGNPPSGQDIIRGSSNIPLSEQGQAEAQRLAQATAGQFDKIYTSPLDRAQATSKAVAATNPQAGTPEPTEALTPWYLGGNEGRPTTEVLAKMQDLIQNHPDEVPAGRGPQSTKPGQSFNDFKDEFLSHVQNQVENYEPGQKILNATHYRDTRVLQAWAKAGASSDFKIDVPTMLEKGDVKPGDLLHLNPQTMEVKAVPNASEPGIYFARHGATAWNAENGSVNPAESIGAPGPAGGGPSQVQPPAAEVARLNAGAPPQAAAAGGGMFLRNFDLDTMARALRSGLNKGSITKSQVSQVLNGQAQLELLRDQLGLKGRIPPNAAAYLRGKVF